MPFSFRPPLPTVGALRNVITDSRPALSFEYDYQVIVQTSLDEVVRKSAKSLFAKHPQRSILVAVSSDGRILDSIRWTVPAGQRPSQGDSFPFSLKNVRMLAPQDGSAVNRVRIVLVGHHRETFKSMDVVRKRLTKVTDLLLSSCGPVDILFSLVSCRLYEPNRTLAESRSGAIALWLMDRADRAQGPGARQRITVRARRYLMSIGDSGRKFSFDVTDARGTVHKGIFDKESTSLFDEFYKAEIRWDDAAQNIVVNLPPVAQAAENVQEAADGCGMCVLLDDGQEWNPLYEDAADHLRAVLAGPDYMPESDDARDRRIALIERARHAVALRQRWQAACSEAAVDVSGGPFITLPGDIRQTADGWEVGLRSAAQWEAPVQVWRPSNDPALVALDNRLRNFASQLEKGLQLDGEGQISHRTDVASADRITTLEAAFLLMMLSGHQQGHTDDALPDAWSDAIQIQTYAYMAQSALGLSDNATRALHIGALALAKAERPFGLLARVSSTAGRVAGPFLDVAALYGAVMQRKAARTEQEITVADANLGITAFMSGVGIGSMTAEMAGQTALAAFVGELAVPLTGLTIGTNALVGRYADLAEQVRATARTLQEVAQAGRNAVNGLRRDGETLVPPAGAVITAINLPANTITLGNVGLATLSGMKGHYTLGRWDHALALPTGRGKPISLYRGVGLTEYASFPALPDLSNQRDNAVLVLPGLASATLQYDFVQCPGARWKSDCPPVLTTMRTRYPDQFIWGLFVFPADYAMAKLRWIYDPTTIRIVPAATTRTLVMPRVDDPQIRQHLRYDIELDHVVLVQLSASPLPMTLKATQTLGGPIVVDVTAAVMQPSTQQPAHDQPGVPHIALRRNVTDLITASHDRLAILDQIIELTGLHSGMLILMVRLPGPATVDWMMHWDHSDDSALRHSLLVPASGLSEADVEQVSQMLAHAGVTDRFIAVASGGDTPATGILDTRDAHCVRLRMDHGGACTHILRNDTPAECWPGHIVVAHALPQQAAGVELVGKYGANISMTLTASSDGMRLRSLRGTSSLAESLRAGAPVTLPPTPGCPVNRLDGVSGVAIGKDGRSIRFFVDGDSMVLDGIAWRDPSASYVVDEDRLLIAALGGKTVRLTADIPAQATTAEIDLIDTPALDISLLPNTLVDITIDVQSVATLDLTLAADTAWQGWRVQGRDIVLRTTSDRLYTLRNADIRKPAAIERLIIRTGNRLISVPKLLGSLPALPENNADPLYGRYVGTNQAGQHFYLKPGTAGSNAGQYLLRVDQGHISSFDLQGVEPLSAHQSAFDDDVWIVGQSGLAYELRDGRLVLAGMEYIAGKRLRLPPPAQPHDYELDAGSTAFAHAGKLYLHVRGNGAFNACVLLLAARLDLADIDISVYARGRPDLAHHILYLAAIDKSLVSGYLVRGAAGVAAASVLLPHEASAMRLASGRIDIEGRDQEGLHIAYTGYIEDGRFYRQS